MIYDCFIFFNELELLELRLNELADVVDRFVLVEATRTFTNKPKPLYFQENHERFAVFADKIIHIVIRDSPDVSEPWAVERFQRNGIARGLTHCRPDDFVLVSDVDEIPRAAMVEKMSREIPYHDNLLANAIHGTLNSTPFKKIFHRKGFRRRLRKNHPFIWKFEQSVHCYFLNCLAPMQKGYGPRMLRFRDFSGADEVRHSGKKIVKDGGWHFTFMGGAERIQAKISAYSHQEFNQPQFMDAALIQQRIKIGAGPFGDESGQLQFVPLDDSLPAFARQHPEKFSGLIWPA